MHIHRILHTLPGLDTVPYKVILTLPDADGVPTSVVVFGIFVYVFDHLQYAKLLEDEVYPLSRFYLLDAQYIFVE